jgi:cell division protein FtsX
MVLVNVCLQVDWMVQVSKMRVEVQVQVQVQVQAEAKRTNVLCLENM